MCWFYNKYKINNFLSTEAEKYWSILYSAHSKDKPFLISKFNARFLSNSNDRCAYIIIAMNISFLFIWIFFKTQYELWTYNKLNWIMRWKLCNKYRLNLYPIIPNTSSIVIVFIIWNINLSLRFDAILQ